MPPVMPRVSTVVSPQEKRALEKLARKLDRPVSWIVREGIRKMLATPKD